jgi:murein L,D-transpeptidase YcbB/YkuD
MFHRSLIIACLVLAPAYGSASSGAAAQAAAGAMQWVRDGRPTRQAVQLTQLLLQAGDFGLRHADYEATALAALAQRLDSSRGSSADLAHFDAQVDSAARRLLHDLHEGRVDPRKAGFELEAQRPTFDVAAATAVLAQADDVKVAVSRYEPAFYHYALLKTALLRYRHLGTDRTLTALPKPSVKTVKPGEPYAGSAALRRLLFELGDLPSQGDDATTLDPALVQALQRFQRRHGLDADGGLGPKTLAALTTPLAQRVQQIELTLERWRWLPQFASPPIIVNIPQFRLFAFRTVNDRAADIMQMDVIVGQTYEHTRTPVFVGDMRYVVYRPYWDVPRSIVLREMLPQILRHADYLQRNHLELVNGPADSSPVVASTPANLEALAAGRLRLRQRPGDDNALGLIKFVFPNSHNVYMHSTPARRLFAESRRAFSHGCIRVSDPVGLAEFVLRGAEPGWDRARIEAAMQGTDALRVPLRNPLKVMILYGTVLATEGGPILFFDDIYGLDRQLARLLQTATRSAPRPAAPGL